MIGGIEALVTSMQAQWQRHEVLANNLANSTTVGFKRDDVVPTRRAPLLDPSGGDPSTGTTPPMLQWTDFSQGPIRETGRDLDVAIDGSGFFVVQTANGERYTRAGAFKIGADGSLATVGGSPVLGDDGPIILRASRVTISPDGAISDGTRTVGTLKVVDFPRPYRLLKEGAGLFAAADASAVPERARDYRIAGEALETSNVNPVETMVSMIEVLRKYEAAQRIIQAVEQANQQSTNDIGKV